MKPHIGILMTVPLKRWREENEKSELNILSGQHNLLVSSKAAAWKMLSISPSFSRKEIITVTYSYVFAMDLPRDDSAPPFAKFLPEAALPQSLPLPSTTFPLPSTSPSLPFPHHFQHPALASPPLLPTRVFQSLWLYFNSFPFSGSGRGQQGGSAEVGMPTWACRGRHGLSSETSALLIFEFHSQL